MTLKADRRLFDMDELGLELKESPTESTALSGDETPGEPGANRKRKYNWRTTREMRNRIVFWAGQNVDKLEGKTLLQVEKVLKQHFGSAPSRQTLARILVDCGVAIKSPPAGQKAKYGDYCTKAAAARIARRTGAAGLAMTEALALLTDALNTTDCLETKVATSVAEKLYQSYVLHASLQYKKIPPPNNELLRLHWEAAGGYNQSIPAYDQDEALPGNSE